MKHKKEKKDQEKHEIPKPPKEEESATVEQTPITTKTPNEDHVTIVDEAGNEIITLKNNTERLLYEIHKELVQLKQLKIIELQHKKIIHEQQEQPEK